MRSVKGATAKKPDSMSPPLPSPQHRNTMQDQEIAARLHSCLQCAEPSRPRSRWLFDIVGLERLIGGSHLFGQWRPVRAIRQTSLLSSVPLERGVRCMWVRSSITSTTYGRPWARLCFGYAVAHCIGFDSRLIHQAALTKEDFG